MKLNRLLNQWAEPPDHPAILGDPVTRLARSKGTLGTGTTAQYAQTITNIESQMDMCVGPACKVKDTTPPPQNDGAVPPKSVKQFNDALNRSGDAKDASRTQSSKDNQSSQHAKDASNGKHETKGEDHWADLSELGRKKAQTLRAMPKLYAAPQAVHLANPPPPVAKPTQTVTNIAAAIRTGPPNFQMTGQNIPVGTRVDVIDTTKDGKFVNVVEHGTNKAIGWTAESNLGDYALSGAKFVYEASVTRDGKPDTVPVMVYLSPTFDGSKANITLYLHGDGADYSASTADKYDRENPGIGMDAKAVLKGSSQILIAPQVNKWGGNMKSQYGALSAGDYESIVQTVLTKVQTDLGLKSPIPRGTLSIAGHSGGGKGLGQAAKDLDPKGPGVADVTLVEAGYGGKEHKNGQAVGGGEFAKSFQKARDWLLEGHPGKVLRVITKATAENTDTRTAIDFNPSAPDHIPVLGREGVTNAIKAKKLDLQADQTNIKMDPKKGSEMQLVRKIVVTRTTDPDKGQVQGTIYVYVMPDPPRGKNVDTHFGVRDATIRDIAAGSGKGDTFGVP